MDAGGLTSTDIGRVCTARDLAPTESGNPAWALRGRLVAVTHYKRADGTAMTSMVLRLGADDQLATVELPSGQSVG